jgi:hypothetical protein
VLICIQRSQGVLVDGFSLDILDPVASRGNIHSAHSVKLRKLLQADVFIISYRPPQVLAICKIDFDTSLLHIFSSQIHADHADICPDVRVRMGLSGNGVLYPKISWLKYHISYIFILSIMDIW